MYLQEPHAGRLRGQQGLPHRTLSVTVWWSLRCLLVVLLCYCLAQSSLVYAHGTTLTQDPPPVTQEIRYHMPEAGEVFLIWGVNGWAVVPEENRPAGTVVKDRVMHTPMAREGDTFVAQVQVPSGTTVDYGFLITKTYDGAAVYVWEADGDQDYHTVAAQDGVVEVQTTLTLAQGRPPAGATDALPVTQEIRYHMPEAGEVFLIWGINGWAVVPEENRPAGTMVKDLVMHTPMVHEGDTFVARVHVPAGTTVDYGFLITKKRDGTAVHVWEADGEQDYHTAVTQDSVIEVQTKLTLAQDQTPVNANDNMLVTMDIRYHMPEAGEVFLIWGINGWGVASEENRPAGTVVKDAVMHTPMVHEGDTFVAQVQMPSGVTVDYGFLITKKRSGAAIQAIWEGDPGYHEIPKQDLLVEVQTKLTLAQARELLSVTELGLCLLLMTCTVVGICATLIRVTRKHDRRTVMLLLFGLTLLGLGLRLYAAWDWNLCHPNTSERLIGDEPGYDNLARGMLQGLGFNWPGRVPLYPFWLAGVYLFTKGSYDAVPYVQSLLGTAVILLTYALGRRIFNRTAGLLAAFFAAISYVLIHQSLHLLSEVLYTPVILLVAIALWDASRKPTVTRFCWAGLWVGVSNLVRPTLLLFPLAAFALLVMALGKRRAIRYWLAYMLVATLVITPWVLHNYARYQAVFPLQTSNAILWQGSPEYYHLIHDQGYTYRQVWAEVLYGPGWEAHDPTSVEGDRWWTRRALRSIAVEPLIYLGYTVEKLGTYWIGDPNADWGDTYVFNYQALRHIGFPQWDAVLFMIGRVLPILALLAAIVIRRRWRTLLPIYAILAYVTVLHAATHAEARLSDPLQPLLLTIIAGAAVTTVTTPREALPFQRHVAKATSKTRKLGGSNIVFWLIVAAYCLYAGAFVYRTSFIVDDERYFSLFDDGMISMRYARNLANGYGLVWNPGGERVEGFTNPLWVLYMSLFHLLPVSASKISVFIQISGILFLTCNLFVVRRIAGLISEGSSMVSLCAVLLTAFYLPLNNWALQGMEVSILTLITSICVWRTLLCLHSGKFSALLYLLLGVATLVRTDMIVPLIAMCIFLLVADQGNRMKHLVVGLSVFVSFVLFQTLFRLWYFGDILPNTYYLKMTGYPLLLRVIRGLIVFLEFIWQMNLIIFAIPFMALLFRRDTQILAMIWIFLAQVGYSIYVGGDAWEWWGGSNRYLVIVMPVFFVLLCYALAKIVRLMTKGWVASRGSSRVPTPYQIDRHNTKRIRYGTIALTLICLLSLNSIHGPQALGEWLLIKRPLLVLDNQYSVKMARLLKEITKDQAKIAVVYAGAIPYFSERNSIDLLGKTDKRIAHEDMRRSSWKYTGFYPGHLKWNYSHSIGELKPDVIAQLWDLWGSSKEAKPYLEGVYTEVEIDGLSLYVRNGSNNIRWSEMPGALAHGEPPR
jgi:4-amino-4-deoxy-L-arabinose transferase-like glycosyltransferase